MRPFCGARCLYCTASYKIRSVRCCPYIRVHGKGRKERHVPLWKSTTRHLSDYIHDFARSENSNLFANCTDGDLTRSGVRYRLDCLQKKASETAPSLAKKNITPHTFRHTTALRMLQAGVDISTIAILLGHERITAKTGCLQIPPEALRPVLSFIRLLRQPRRTD